MISCAAAYDHSIYRQQNFLKLGAQQWWMEMKWIWHFVSCPCWGVLGSQGCFCRAGLLSEQAAGGMRNMLVREMEFQICLQFTLSFLLRSDCFVCLFFILVAGNNDGEMDDRIWRHICGQSSLYLSHVLCCAGDASRILLYQTVCLPCKDLIILIFLTFMICSPSQLSNHLPEDISGMLCLKNWKKSTMLSFWIISF